MSDREIQFKELLNKVEKLINLHTQLVKDRQLLLDRQQELLQTVESQQQQLNVLEEKYKVTRMAQAISGGNDQNTREIKLKINEYIREIDKCLALINR